MVDMVFDNERFIMKQTEWRGEVTAKLDNINSETSEIKQEIKQLRQDIRNINRRINQTNIRVAGIAGTISVVVTIVGILIGSLVV